VPLCGAMERKTFPKHESLAASFEREVSIACIPSPPYFSMRAACCGRILTISGFERNVQVSRKNAVLLYVEDPPGSVAGYAIISTRLPPAPKGGNIEKVCVAESM